MNSAMPASVRLSCSTAQQNRFMPPPAPGGRVQLLREDGKLITDPDFEPLSTGEKAAELFREMTLMRRFDTECTALQRKGQLGLWAPLLGQEAIQTGIAAALGSDDHVFPSHREHGLAMLMGIPIEQLLAIFSGREMGDWDAEEPRFHHLNMVIGAHTLHGVGYAMGQARDRERDSASDDGVSLVIHGDGAISEGDVNEAYVFAASYHAPVVFVCVNNQWAISEPVTVQSKAPLYQRAWGFGIPSIQVDGNDVLAMQSTTNWALERARSGQGPTFIEAYTYRMGAHTTSDDPTKYRAKKDSLEWQLKDPLMRTQTWLSSQGLWGDEQQVELDRDCGDLGARIRGLADELVDPAMDDIFDRVYHQLTPDLRAQRDQLRAEAALR